MKYPAVQIEGQICPDGVTAGPNKIDNVVELVERTAKRVDGQAVKANVRLQIDCIIHSPGFT